MALLDYSNDILTQITSSKEEAQIMTNVLMFLQVATTLFASLAIERRGRRYLLILSQSLICGSLLGVLVTEDLGFGAHWVIVFLTTFMIGYSLGIGPVPMLYAADILP